MSSTITTENDTTTLILTKHELILPKNFGNEVRAIMDIEYILRRSALILDVKETIPEDIYKKVIHELIMQDVDREIVETQIKSSLFTNSEASKILTFFQTVQALDLNNCADYDQTWISALCTLPNIQHRHVAIARLSRPTNLGKTMEDVRFIILVIAPSREKETKTALETAKTIATLFADIDIRQRLIAANCEKKFFETLLSAAKELQKRDINMLESGRPLHIDRQDKPFVPNWYPFSSVKNEFFHRIRYYLDDIKDGVIGPKTVQKLFSTIVFLYFACLLPSIALGVLNDTNTAGKINVKKVIFAQAIGGIFFAIFGGQPMVILITTAPLAIYIKVIYTICEEMGYEFFAIYCAVGLFCQLFLIIYAAFGLSWLMKFATRSAEEKFSLFIAIALTVESFRAVYNVFKNNYSCSSQELINGTFIGEISSCTRDMAILFLLLMFGTLWLGLFLFNFRKTPYLTRTKREILTDYALPLAVLVMSFTGSYLFSDISNPRFNMHEEIPILQLPDLASLPFSGYIIALILGFSLSLLFFIDQNISAAISNSSQHKLKKGKTDNLDLIVVAILNIFLSLLGLPWMHGGLPHSPLHVRALADIEEHIFQGYVQEVITNVRETRLPTFFAHILILMTSFWFISSLQVIPTAVLYGLFLYMAITSLHGNDFFERILFFVTEQVFLPPTHYIRRVPQRKVHLFTAIQLLELGILCVFGFMPFPFVKMLFPIVFCIFIPIRQLVLPNIIDKKHLEELDKGHT